MNALDIFDAIIVGGGPAGLAVGSELAAKHRILLIDRQVVGKTARSWFVPLDAIDEKVMPFTYNGVTRFITQTFGGADIAWTTELFKHYPYVNEKTILPHWRQLITNHGSQVLDECTYLDSSVEAGIVTVETSQGRFRGRLLIDASGYNSPIVEKYRIDRSNDYWWSVAGSINEHPQGLDGMQVGDYMMWQTFRDTNADVDASMADGRPIFSYEILNENTSFSFAFYLRKERVPREVMESEYMKLLREEPATANFHAVQIKEPKFGWYPSGGLSQQIAEDHVVFIGDAGCWTTPCGWGMTFILRNYREFAGKMSVLLNEGRLDRKNLLSVPHYKVHEKYEVLLDTIVTHFLSVASASQLDRFIRLFDKIPKILCEKVFTLTISRQEVHTLLQAMLQEFKLSELIHILPKRDYLLVLDEAKYFAEDAVLDEMHKLSQHFHKTPPSPPSGLNDGYNFS
jgi:flavin-dependent dehydrogenase